MGIILGMGILLIILNLIGIMAVAVVIILLMNLSEKESIAKSTIRREREKLEDENRAIAEVSEQISDLPAEKRKVIKEDIVV
jgi:uncharacterized membrane protein